MALPRFTELLTVTSADQDDIVVVGVTGEIDLETRDSLADSVFRELADRPAKLVIDLSNVGFIGSVGLSVLVRAQHEARKIPTALRIVVNTPQVMRPLQICGLAESLPLCHSVPDAVLLLGSAS